VSGGLTERMDGGLACLVLRDLPHFVSLRNVAERLSGLWDVNL